MEYIIHLVILISIFAILGVSLNLVVGYTGLLSVTHAAFFGMGAYTTALLMRHFSLNFFLALLAGGVVTAFGAWLIGLVSSKFRGDYYALVTLGFNGIMFSIFINWQAITRGPLGIPGITRPELFGFSFFSNTWFLVLAVISAAVIYYLAKFIVNSSFGRVLKAIREDEDALKVFGYRTSYFKLAIFVISAAMAAVAGSLFASYISFIDPSAFTIFEAIFVIAIIILGGLANIKGSVLGAIFLILLPEALRFIGFPDSVAAQMRQLVYGVLLVVLMLYRPQGLIGEYKL